ncbi:hypothetical protein BCR33DRAFT_715037 [Rhizoclosmatium globosum]|uniref:Uncharacterized protein n=1 Tax=Rhizoclosmatium globosum TaxID=329046 RepID=A0A1Y2CJT2_9FUNG|nr:hypothetical protein BCR33DRAFT_715037 [Rhizoclosmatium globosum]|eukprot:ORY47288.1 hypothetical protein BCR33DRAFT_715037 [Rhizoclosmatium globosum]
MDAYRSCVRNDVEAMIEYRLIRESEVCDKGQEEGRGIRVGVNYVHIYGQVEVITLKLRYICA